MKKMVMSSIIIGIVVAVITIGILSNPSEVVEDSIEIENIIDDEIIVDENVSIEIQEKLDEIKKNSLENQYTPKSREWITSGPFQIDRSEYLLGEKIFMRFGEIQPNEKGQVAVLRPMNDTHYSVFLTIPFDGMNGGGFNYYFQPSLLPSKGTCSVEDIIGKWTIVFRGTQYSNLDFNVINQTLPGDEDDFYVPVC